ncbi:MAG: AraC family transcriptional regulator [Candidatus Limiplasma sp.]|nr:AraC family transcriptional regulator [Candidatus Limiplasma sp.]
MDISFLEDIRPNVVTMRIKRAVDMYGKWQDDEYVFTYIAGGSAEFFVNGGRFFLKTGDMIVLPPKAAHIIASKGDEPLVQYIFHFDYFDAPDREIPWGNNVFVATANEGEKYDLSNNYLRMYKEFDEQRPGYRAMLTGIALQLLVPYFRASGNVAESRRGDAKTKSWVHIENAVSYIYKNLCQTELDNQQIASAVGVSANYLTKLFQDQLGISLHTYMLNIRIERAKQLMYKDNKSLTEVAYLCGFSGIHVFSKIFKKIVGMSPSKFLENSVLKAPITQYEAVIHSREN